MSDKTDKYRVGHQQNCLWGKDLIQKVGKTIDKKKSSVKRAWLWTCKLPKKIQWMFQQKKLKRLSASQLYVNIWLIDVLVL